MHKETRDLMSLISGFSRAKKPYVTEVKSVRKGIATLKNGLKVELKGGKPGDSVVVVHRGITPIGVKR